ncbi:MAG TPA: hypothetical protein VKB95_03080 [Chitinophagaceae bacterium]|nr:hypothetical protein [Chitinophagaceae bacterium]
MEKETCLPAGRQKRSSRFEVNSHYDRAVFPRNGAPGKNPQESQFSVYGSAHVGIFGSIIRATDVPGILQLNLLSIDFYHDKAWPTYLYYNPYNEEKLVSLNIEKDKTTDLYNTVSGQFVARDISTSTQVKLATRSAAVIVIVPADGKVTYESEKMLVNGTVVDYKFQHKK